MKILNTIFIAIAVFLIAPASYAQGPESMIKSELTGDIYFAKGSFTLDEKSKKELGGLAEWIKKNRGSFVMLAGYDERTNPADVSAEISKKRADAVRDYLVSLGVDNASISVISFGNSRIPKEGPRDDAKDRRVRYRVAKPPDNERMEGPPASVCQRCKK